MHNTPKWRWFHGAALFGSLQVFLFGLGAFVNFIRGKARPAFGEAIVGSEDNDDYYNQFRQPFFAPPDWAFAPVWTVNNALNSWGIVRVLNMPEGTPGRERYLQLQAAFALQFVNFNAAYFSLNSPISGAGLTLGGLLPIAACMRIALADMKDWRVALSLSTLLPWLILASFTSVTVALWNRDDLFRTPAPVEPPAALLKPPTQK